MYEPPKSATGPASPTAPNQVWVGDITYLPKQGGGWLYLATWLERYSRKAVGWDVRDSVPEDLVSEALRRALSVHQPAAGPVVHSDQGSQYSATPFKALVARHEAVQSMSRRGNATVMRTPNPFGVGSKPNYSTVAASAISRKRGWKSALSRLLYR